MPFPPGTQLVTGWAVDRINELEAENERLRVSIAGMAEPCTTAEIEWCKNNGKLPEWLTILKRRRDLALGEG